MFYAFIDGKYAYRSGYVGYLKERVAEDMEHLNYYSGVIYQGERMYCVKIDSDPWMALRSTVKNRPAID